MASTLSTDGGEWYSYRELRETPPEVRLFVLLPGEASDPIRGRITHHVLEDGLQYDALSYMWGDPAPAFTITVDGDKRLAVPANLYAALRDLRHPTDSLRIWVDAICINQPDTSERNHQVPLMHSIYNRPQLVRVWLDQDVDGSHPSIQKLVSFASVDLENLDFAGAADLLGIADLISGFWDPVMDIFRNPYWNRLWVQQEIILAPKFVTHCRHVVIPGEAIVAFGMIVARALGTLHDSNDASSSDELQAAEKKIFNFDAPCRDIYHLRRRIHSAQDGKDSHSFSDWCTLLGNLLQYGAMKATEPRDGLYGLLGLCLDVSEGDIVVDYQASLPEVYADVARFCIEKYANINFLCHCGLSQNSHDLTDAVFPSWLPNWRNMDAKARGGAFMDDRPRAGGRSCPRGPTRLSSDRRSLFVRGLRVDSVASATTEPFHDEEPVASVFNRLRDITKIGNLAEDETIVHDQSDIKKTVLSRLESLAQKVQIGLREVAMAAGALGYEQDDEKRAVRRIVGLLIGRRAARLSSGRWGLLVDADVHPEDEVWVLFGCAYPMILRPAGGQYRVVSPMHIRGLMDGEIVEGLTNMDADVHTFGSRSYPISTIQLV
ncbi:Heterokaryon incompatibility protein 6, OR allele [Madurella mycetomatis]|uniref:Heterokaryon incompatibility protein 6, OR allele n=1 Tax=Madurella mycetomatis TaxID=100816 RepID=A0A175VRN8_9PEZI|nr:Heterokaryon incompatibility protein 6, OR allele [Madurella mycetomatis]KXX79935.1 Heterokaryon incompatibility protein 6, OR allele [Madurella mycetomatis]